MNKCMLVVDDDLLSRMFIKRTMQKHGFQVFEAENGQQALDVLQQNKEIEVVTLDLNMPVMDGFTFLKEVSGTELGMRLRIYITSCYSRNEFVKRAAVSAIDTSLIFGYFEKPFHVEHFIDTMLRST